MTDSFAEQDVDGQQILTERLRAGADAMVVGEREPVRFALATAARALGEDARIVHASAPPGGLSLSGLMAQLSGRDDLGAHDDSVLEEVFRLLSGAGAPNGRAVLVLDACEGLQRSVLQYIHQAGRILPGLSLVIGAESVPEALEEAPALLGLRARLLRFEPVRVHALPQPVPVAPQLSLAPFRVEGRFERARRRRAAGSWAVTGMGMAASLVVGVLVGHATTPRAEREAWPAMTRATLSLPGLAALAVPSPSSLPPPILAAAAEAPILAVPPAILLADIPPPRPIAAPALNLAATTMPATTTPVPSRAAPVVVGLLQEGGGDVGWSGPARVLAERPVSRRGRAYPVRSRLTPPSTGVMTFESAEQAEPSPMSPDQVEEVRSHFRARRGWVEPPPPPSPDDYDW